MPEKIVAEIRACGGCPNKQLFNAAQAMLDALKEARIAIEHNVVMECQPAKKVTRCAYCKNRDTGDRNGECHRIETLQGVEMAIAKAEGRQEGASE